MSDRHTRPQGQQPTPIRNKRNKHTASDQSCCGCCACCPSQQGPHTHPEHDDATTVGDLAGALPRRIAYSVDEAAHLLSVGRDSIYELIRTRQLRTFKIGARRLVAHRDIENCVDHQAEATA